MITKRDFILRGSCFCEMYNLLLIKITNAQNLRTVITVHARKRVVNFNSFLCGTDTYFCWLFPPR